MNSNIQKSDGPLHHQHSHIIHIVVKLYIPLCLKLFLFVLLSDSDKRTPTWHIQSLEWFLWKDSFLMFLLSRYQFFRIKFLCIQNILHGNLLLNQNKQVHSTHLKLIFRCMFFLSMWHLAYTIQTLQFCLIDGNRVLLMRHKNVMTL